MTPSPRKPLDDTIGTPTGRVPAGAPVPDAWHGVGGGLDLITRADRGTVYQPTGRRRVFHLAVLVGVIAVIGAGAGLAAIVVIAHRLGL